MSLQVRFDRAVFLLLPVFGVLHSARATPADTTADAVLGQANFTENKINRGNAAPDANTLNDPQRMAIDPTTGRLWLADSGNNRVLSWPNPAAFKNGDAADIVLGQKDFKSGDINRGGLTPDKNTFNQP